MKFIVSQSSLTQAIGVVMKGVASASTLPILSGVLVKAQDVFQCGFHPLADHIFS